MPLPRTLLCRLVLFIGLCGAAVCIDATPLQQTASFKSTTAQTGVLELYTSEGCSSCPPADSWLSSLKDEDGLWREFIPLAFHVDYWDYIGWQDRFASPTNSNRQRQYARERSLKTVYTPGFLYNGEEWRGWFSRRFIDLPEGNRPGVLTLDVTDGVASTEFVPQIEIVDDLVLNVALLAFDLSSEVTAGENRGRKLPHDFIVLGVATANFVRDSNTYRSQSQIPTAAIVAPRYGVVAWVSRRGRQAPLQATGGWLPLR